MITGAARVAGVIGWPIAHSRSPTLHNHWLATYKIDGAYVPFAVEPADFTRVIHALRAAGLRGANITIPHKEAAFALCDRLDDAARAAGAVNTLIFTATGIEGRNTDGIGFTANLRAHGVNPASGPALLLGAGGAARAIAAALLAENAPVTITNRSPERAQALARALPGLRVLPWEARAQALAETALLVNTTACGMKEAPDSPIGLAQANAALTVADIVYVPRTTRLLAAAEARGLATVGGLGMLLHQAVPGFAAWFGTTPMVDAALGRLIGAGIPETC